MTARIGDCGIGQCCCCCSWQSTLGPQGLLLLRGTTLLLFHGNQFGQSNCAWHDQVTITSCDQQHKTIDHCVGGCIIVISLQSSVLWRVGASQEWWQLSARSTHSVQMCEHNVFVLFLQSTTLVAAWHNCVDVAYHDDDIKVFDQCICCDSGCRDSSFITGAMALLQGWRIAIGAINFTMGTLAFLQSLKVVAQSSTVVRSS